jgi:hypothetical protein
MFLLLTITNVPLLVKDGSTSLASTLSALAGRNQPNGFISSGRMPVSGETRIIKLYATQLSDRDSFDFTIQERIPTTPEGSKMLTESVSDETYRKSKIENGALFSTAWISVGADSISVRHSGSNGIFEATVQRETGEITSFENERVGVRTPVIPNENNADEHILRPLEVLSRYLRTLAV